MESIRLSGGQLKDLRSAIPFEHSADGSASGPGNEPVIEPPAASADGASLSENFDPEPYRKKFRKKYGGDVVQGTAFGYGKDILLDPPDADGKPLDDVSPL